MLCKRFGLAAFVSCFTLAGSVLAATGVVTDDAMVASNNAKGKYGERRPFLSTM